MKNVKLKWADFKVNLLSRKSFIQYYTESNHYKIFFVDGQIEFNTEIEIEIIAGAYQVDFETNYKNYANLPLDIRSPLTGRPEVIVVESEGDGETLPSHNFMDKTTWYQSSSSVLGETPVLSTGKTYNLVNSNIIDNSHGKITFEDLLTNCDFKAYDGSTELMIQNNFVVNYINGTITIDASYTLLDVLTVDYAYSVDSTFAIKPAVGKILSIKDAEIQFTSDLVMKPMTFEIWAYNTSDYPNKIPVFSRRYKNIKDIINVARQGKGLIPAIDVVNKEILVFPFSYDRKIALEHSKGMELRVRMDNDEPMGGEYGTITFYVTYEDE